ncbi:hypothetical protein [Streptomyces sp. NPDC102360]|uniref:hypothetical protein n=1 Tax=Streptomyces sp. NPDC102360 TaxID=3366160 RepID=UPI00382E314A
MTRIAMIRRKCPLLLVVGFIAVAAVIATVLGLQSPSPPASASPPTETSPTSPADEADGVVPDGVTVFDDTTPAVGKLAPGLLKALRQAAADASRAGVTFYVKLRPEAVDHGCPDLYANPTEDPRMQK